MSWFNNPPGPTRLTPLFPGLHQQTPGQVLLINDLSNHRTDHLVIQQIGRISHSRPLSDQARPHTPLIRQSLARSMTSIVTGVKSSPTISAAPRFLSRSM